MCRSCGGRRTAACLRASLRYRVFAGDRLACGVADLQHLAHVQRVRRRDVVAFRKVAEIVAGDPGDIEQGIAALNGIGTAAGIATFRNIAIFTVVNNLTVQLLYFL